MKIKYLLPVFVILLMISCAEDPIPGTEMPMDTSVCNTERYTSPIFSDLDSMTVKYADKDFTTGHLTDLYMDIYMPAGDTLSNRPVMLWAFGGAFITGDRSQVAFLARQSAKLGFVSATIDYRILPFSIIPPDSTIMMNTAIKATADMKAAVRYFKMDADQGNSLNIDPDQIYVGGISAGAITALMTGILDEADINNDFLQELIDGNGGLDGNTGSPENQSYDNDVAGIVSLSGAVYDLDFIDSTDPPIFSVHGDADEVVAYTSGKPNVGLDIDIILYGGKTINDRCMEIGLKNELITVVGGGHVDIYVDSEYAQTRMDFLALGNQFIKEEICQ